MLQVLRPAYALRVHQSLSSSLQTSCGLHRANRLRNEPRGCANGFRPEPGMNFLTAKPSSVSATASFHILSRNGSVKVEPHTCGGVRQCGSAKVLIMDIFGISFDQLTAMFAVLSSSDNTEH